MGSGRGARTITESPAAFVEFGRRVMCLCRNAQKNWIILCRRLRVCILSVSLPLKILTKGGVHMLIIPIKDGENIDRALKRYKRKFDKTGTVRQLRARQAFVKPSVVRRSVVQKAQYIQKLRDSLEG